MNASRITWLLALLCMTVPAAATAQTTSTILGVVRDGSGGVVPGVSVTAKHLATNAVRTVITDESGTYVIPFLGVGEYDVLAELTGFQTGVRRIVLAVDQRARVELVLEAGGFSETTNVLAEAPVIKTDSSDIGSVIDNKRIVELPLNGRNFVALNALDAGAATRTGAGGSYFQLFGGGYSFSGSPGDSSSYSADGIAMKGQGDARVTMKITVDTIQEFKQQQALFSAESGGGGGNVNVITKGGSNDLRGSAWEFHRNSAFDARNYFDPAKKPPFKLNQYGFTAGGPIVKDRTFFFGSYEGTRTRKEVGRAFTVPSVADRAGDFSGRSIIYDPATTRPDPARPGQFIRDPFPGNVIPANRIDPVAAKTLELMFPPAGSAGLVLNLNAPMLNETKEDQFTVRVDHRFSGTNNAFVRYTLADPRRTTSTFASLPNYGDNWNTRAQNVAITHTSVLTQRVVNDFRFGFNRMFQYLQSTEQRNLPELLGITGTQSNVYPGPPTISIAGYNTTASLGNTPNNRAEETWQITNNTVYSRGNHSIGAGLDLKALRLNGGNAANARGSFSFTRRFTTLPGVANTGDAMADFLLGYPTNASAGEGNGYANIRQALAAFYIKDDWRVTPALTLNIGLRYEYFSPLTEKRDRIPSFDAAAGTLVPVAQNGIGRGLYERDLNNFAPRVGFAYQPFGNARTVVRGGYGIFYSAPMPVMGWAAGGTLRQNVTVVSDPTFPNITLANAFPQELRQVGRSISVIDRNLRTPYNQQWTLGVQRDLGKEFVLDVAYLGNQGTNLISGSAKNINQPAPGPGPVAARLPYPNFSSISLANSEGWSNYHGLRSGLQRRFTQGFSLNVSHVWSHMLDTTGTAFQAESGNNARRDVNDRRNEKGNSIFDARHRLVISYVLESPFKQRFLSGWQLSGVTTFQSGTPVDAGLSFDNANTGSVGDNRPNLIGDPNSGPRTPEQWFNIAAFGRPEPFTFGNSGKNVITGPGYQNFDLSVSRNFGLGGIRRVQLRAEIFNLLNHTNFNAPNATFGNSQFGVISSAAEGREIQFGVKFVF